MESKFVLKEGWAVKESGQALLGQTNWRKRWCQVVRTPHGIFWSYYRKTGDIVLDQPAGRIELDSTYVARGLEEGETKKKPNCFALGPVFDNFAKRTYYISCDSEDDKLSWMEVINAAIESDAGELGERFEKNRMSVRQRLSRRLTLARRANHGKADDINGHYSYMEPTLRLEQWKTLCLSITRQEWKKKDTKNGVTISRLSFAHNDKAVMKVEGIIPVPPDITYEYLQRAMQKGGKLDQPFRGEEVLQRMEESLPHASIVHNTYSVPLPSVSSRDTCLVRMWMPSYLLRDGASGLVVWSTVHPKMPEIKDVTRVLAGPSGFVLTPVVLSDSSVHTNAVVLVNIDFKDSLQTMLEGSYRSGLLKIGLRTAFAHISQLVEKYYQYIEG